MKWPFVKRSTYESLLAEYTMREDSYWRQFSINTSWERKFRASEQEIKILKSNLVLQASQKNED